MPLPRELHDIPEDTTVVGDVDALFDYIESPEALKDLRDRFVQREREKELDELSRIAWE